MIKVGVRVKAIHFQHHILVVGVLQNGSGTTQRRWVLQHALQRNAAGQILSCQTIFKSLKSWVSQFECGTGWIWKIWIFFKGEFGFVINRSARVIYCAITVGVANCFLAFDGLHCVKQLAAWQTRCVIGLNWN